MFTGPAELQQTALLLTVLGFLVAGSAIFSRQIDRLGIPVVLLFLVLGMLGGSEGIGGIAFESYGLAVRVGTVYLVLILFEGGMNTSMAAVRRVILPSGLLATIGVAATAGLLACFARLLGLSWNEALVLGAVVSSTDAAAVLAVLRGGGLNLRPRVGDTLEVESCINDPMAVILTVAMVQVAVDPAALGWSLLWNIPLQLVVGAAAGSLLGAAGRRVIPRVAPATIGLYPALTLAIAFLSFGIATLLRGSGLLSVYMTGLVLGSAVLPYRAGLDRIHNAVAWLSQVGLFLMFGLLIFPSRLVPVAGIGLAIGLFLAFVARPVAVWLCLLPFNYSRAEKLYVAWIGLRGAVPIILAAFPVLSQVNGADRIFNIVFFIVVVSTILPGATIRPVTRWLRQATPEAPRPSALLEINSAHPLEGEIASFFIEPEAAVCGVPLSQITLPTNAAVMLVVRDNNLLAARGPTVLQPGDHAFVYFPPSDRPYIELLFGHAERR